MMLPLSYRAGTRLKNAAADPRVVWSDAAVGDSRRSARLGPQEESSVY